MRHCDCRLKDSFSSYKTMMFLFGEVERRKNGKIKCNALKRQERKVDKTGK